MANKKNSKKKGRRILPYEKSRKKNLGNKKIETFSTNFDSNNNKPDALLHCLFTYRSCDQKLNS